MRDLEKSDPDFLAAQDLLHSLQSTAEGSDVLTLELLDPRGRSQIIHEDVNSRDLYESEMATLSTGPDIPVFEID